MAINYIADNQELKNCITHLNKYSEFAIDLEFDKNRYRYGFNLCLMQIFTGDECFLIDPLSDDLNTELIFPVLENPDIQKVVFAFGEDLRLLHSLGCFPKNIFDLDVITSLLNYPPSSLTNLIADILEIEVGKSSQQSNWFRRPLSDQQLKYAAEDVLHLLKLKKELNKLAREEKIDAWVMQENSMFDSLDYSDEDHNTILKEKDKKDLTEYEWHLFSSISEFVDSIAKKHNKPAYQIIGKNLLFKIVKDPALLDEWNELSGVYKKLKTEKFKTEFETVLQKSIIEAEKLELSKEEPADKKLSKEEYLKMREEQRKFGRLKNEVFSPIQRKIAEDYGKNVKSFILSNRQMKELINGNIELPEYKKELFQQYADELNIDIEEFINSENKDS